MNEQAKALISGILGVLILMLAFSGCTSTNQMLEPTETFNLQTRLAQITPSATPTLIPTLHSPYRTSTPVPTYMPGTEDSLFPVPNQIPWIHITRPTPIPTPNVGEADFILKEWTDNDALSLVQLADHYAYEAGVAGFSSSSEYPSYQELVSLSIKEFQNRFPHSKYSQEIQWKLAVSNLFIWWSSERVEEFVPWIGSQIETALNTDDYSINDLDKILLPKGITYELHPVENIKGDGRVGYLLFFNPTYLESNRSHHLFVITQDFNRVNVDFLQNDIISVGEYSIPKKYLQDQDEDGIPEIILLDKNRRLRILEWQGGRFYDHSQVNMYGEGGDLPGEPSFEFDPPEYPDIDLVTYRNKTQGYVKTFWKWENGAYQHIGEYDSNPFSGFVSFGQLVPKDDYTENISGLEAIVTNWDELGVFSNHSEVLQEAKGTWQLNLGFTYLFVDKEKGLDVIRSVVDSPYKEGHVSIQIAKIFLENYHGEKDQLVLACDAVGNVFNDYYYRENSSSDKETQEFHFNNTYLAYFCDERILFDLLLSEYSDAPLQELITQLSKAKDFKHKRFLIEGISIELVRFGEDYLLGSINGEIKLLGRLYLSDIESVSISQQLLPALKNPLYMLNSSRNYYLMEIRFEDKNPKIKILIDEWVWDDSRREVIAGDGAAYYHLISVREVEYGDGNLCDDETWVEMAGYMMDYDNKSVNQVDIFEELIFHLKNYDLAIEKIQADLAFLDPYHRDAFERNKNCDGYYFSQTYSFIPRLLYLLGLAYELNGDKTLAVQTYYRLWQEAPDSGYALMARAKLEEVVP